jgi:dATP pyrophosphohydrolase
MARQPKQVHVFLFRQKDNKIEYAIFQRTDMLFCWQGICGGLEDNETLKEGARREIFEEAGIKEQLPLYPLESISYLPDNIFSIDVRTIWGKEVIVVPMYFFAMHFNGQVKLSDEHNDMKWLTYDDAYNLIYYKDQQIALYELNEKLLRNIIS